jgi:hypothetical protein
MTDKLTGGNTNYYLAEIEYPKRGSAYTAECEDIITALKMTFAEGCAFKAIWRSASARLGNGKPGADEFGIYDGEKISHYGKRILVERHIAQDKAVEQSKVPLFAEPKDLPETVLKPSQPPGLAAYPQEGWHTPVFNTGNPETPKE